MIYELRIIYWNNVFIYSILLQEFNELEFLIDELDFELATMYTFTKIVSVKIGSLIWHIIHNY